MEGLAATEDTAGVAGPVDMVATVEVEDLVGIGGITVATEAIITDVVDIVGIMVGMVDIMVEAISTEDPASTSADTLGSRTTIPTGIILPPIIILTPITILINRINRMLLPGLPPTPNRSKIPIGILPGSPRVLPLRHKLIM